MDLSLFRRTQLRATRDSCARIDYRVFVATLQALQLATPTAKAESLFGRPAARGSSQAGEPLPDILLGSDDWQEAVLARGGSFNPALARLSAFNEC